MTTTLPDGLQDDLGLRSEPRSSTKIDRQTAISISRKAYEDAGLVGINNTKFTPKLCRWNERWVWQVDWLWGAVEIAATSGAITVDADTGKVLHMYKSTQKSR